MRIGDTVLFRLGPEIQRPLYVTKVHRDGELSGELFFYHPEDVDCAWALGGGMFYPPSISRRSTWVEGALRGDGIGQWLPREEIPFSEKLGLVKPKRAYRRRKAATGAQV